MGAERTINWTQWQTGYLWYAKVPLCESHQASLHGTKDCYIDWEQVSLLPPANEVYRSPARVTRMAFKGDDPTDETAA